MIRNWRAPGLPSVYAGEAARAPMDAKKSLARISPRPHRPSPAHQVGAIRRMKAKIIVTPKKAVLDPQGKTVQNALAHLGYTGVTGVHVGKYIEIDLAPGTDRSSAQQALNEAALKFLSNPVIEDYHLEIVE